MIIERSVSLLELIELLDDGYRDDDIMFVELIDAGTVVQQNIGVENKQFLFPWSHVNGGSFSVCVYRLRLFVAVSPQHSP